MHGELGKSDVHRRHGNLGVGNISQGGTAGDIAPVRKDLCRYFYAAAKVAEEGGGESVSGVFLLGIEFNDDAFIQARRVYGIGIFSMIRMERVAVVGGNHEASGNHGLCFVIAVTQRTGDSCQCILEEGGTGALICGAANFFIIEKGVNTDMLFLFSCGESTDGHDILEFVAVEQLPDGTCTYTYVYDRTAGTIQVKEMEKTTKKLHYKSNFSATSVNSTNPVIRERAQMAEAVYQRKVHKK